MEYDDLKLPLIIGVLGFIFSTKRWITFLDKLNPYVRMVLFYVMLVIIIIVLEYYGLIVSGIRLETLPQTIGTILIIFAFFIAVDLQSCYVDTVLGRTCRLESDPSKQSEDELVYQFWSRFFKDINVLRIMTYVVTPVVLSMIGAFMMAEDVTLSPFRFMQRRGRIKIR